MARKRKTTRRGNGEGSIYQRKDGRWGASLTVGFDQNGKPHRRHVYRRTKKEVVDELARLKGQQINGTLGEPTKLTVAEFLKRWLEDSVKPQNGPSTYSNYETMVRVHINPRIGGVKLTNLTPAHVQAVYSAMKRSGRTKQLCHTVLRRALKQAVRWNIIPRSPCDAVDPPKADTKEFQPLTLEQTQKLLKTAKGDRLEALYVLAVTTGLRQGELLALQWDDVDLKSGRLAVRYTLSTVDNKTLTPPKSAKGRRTVDLPRLAVDALHAYRKRILTEGHAGASFVFVNYEGNPIDRNNLRQRTFKSLLKRAELPLIRFHDLRHTAATLMLQQGVHPKIVQERLGHATIGMTLDIYSHVLPNMQKEAADKMDQALGEVGA